MLTNKVLTAEEAQKEIKTILEERECTDILFPDPKDDLIVATFNCKELTSFNQPIAGWTYSGIQLDPTTDPATKRQYKIDFKKIENGG